MTRVGIRRGVKLTKELSDEERHILMLDAQQRLERSGLSISDVENMLDIWEE